MEKYIIFGTGEVGRRAAKQLEYRGIYPIAFTDNNSSIWGKEIEGIPVLPPDKIINEEYDAIVISTSDYYDEVYSQLINELNIEPPKIKYCDFFLKDEFVGYYDNISSRLSDEQLNILKAVKTKERLEVFNYPFTNKYENEMIAIEKDIETGMLYHWYHGKKMYLSRKYSSIKVAQKYVKSLMMEQDLESPHRYLTNDFDYDGGVVLDAGVAEGNFSLDIIDRAEHIVLVEPDPLWIEALNYTFKPYKDKVTIINKFLGGGGISENVTSIDELNKKFSIEFIKMDIEGAEVQALNGGKNSLESGRVKKVVACAYHNNDDENKIKSILKKYNYYIHEPEGYMLFPYNESEPARLVHGLVKAEKM